MCAILSRFELEYLWPWHIWRPCKFFLLFYHINCYILFDVIRLIAYEFITENIKICPPCLYIEGGWNIKMKIRSPCRKKIIKIQWRHSWSKKNEKREGEKVINGPDKVGDGGSLENKSFYIRHCLKLVNELTQNKYFMICISFRVFCLLFLF